MRLEDLVASAARVAPDSPAVRAPDGELTYRQLDALAERYAAALAARGVGAGDRVVIWSGKSLHAVALMQGCLRVNAVYAPVAESNPPTRLAKIADGCTAALVVTDAEGLERVPEASAVKAPVLSFGELLAEPVSDAPTGAVRAVGGPDDPAYLLYTSGSTGDPKGVCVSHRNALAFVEWAVDHLGLGPGDRLANHAPFNFDLSVFDLYAAFAAGAEVHLIPQGVAYAPELLVRLLFERRITVWYSVPSALTLMMSKGGLLDQDPPRHLRICLFAGEPFPLPYAQRLRAHWPDVRMFNWYGPTETNVCTSYEVTADDLARSTPLPIGTAASGDTLELRGGEEEDVRELWVSGPSVMLGYWGREPQRGAYPTGDLVRETPDGNLEYAGRRDHMVKIRGQRVELGEIESVLDSHPSVADSAVVVVGEGLRAALHAVIVPQPGSRVSFLLLKQWCAERLPVYMLLDVLHTVDELPRTENGKKDRMGMAEKIESGRF
ncbi:amino acid adenylation domain-containing protein [Streptomyces sedi]|uniref:D-alanine--poly(Phosphoribitol) ligase n=1 Tax=Streptomyces sedi TaxID=555059 RepID=A0A5C4V405_9ACTN|nr:amino acid adenylation domain-containing protein [Streptomyces sedi]TNM30580.1 D-alanine--poly(phosphoribitol) ligase [Streptomyces sedi]